MKRKYVFIGLLVALAIFGLSFISEYICSHTCHYTEAANNDASLSGIFCAFVSFVGGNIDGFSLVFTTAATVVMAIFTRSLVRVSRTQARIGRVAADAAKTAAEAATQSGELAAKEFVATHRPKIRVKHVVLNEELSTTTEITANVAIVNSGNAELRLREYRFATYIVPMGDWLPVGLLDKRQRIPIKDTTMTGGLTIVINGCTDGRFLQEAGLGKIKTGSAMLYCVGDIEYQDMQIPPRIMKTAFCRVFRYPSLPAREGVTGRFLAIPEDTDYEYQD